jgi:hypothetical protein
MGKPRFTTVSFGIWREHTILEGRQAIWEPEYDTEIECVDVNSLQELYDLLEKAYKIVFGEGNNTSSPYIRNRAYSILCKLHHTYKDELSCNKTNNAAFFLWMMSSQKLIKLDGETWVSRDKHLFDRLEDEEERTKQFEADKREAFNAAREKLGLTATDEDYSLWLRS